MHSHTSTNNAYAYPCGRNLLPQTNARRSLQQVNIARYSLQFSSNTIADAGILSQLRFTYQNFVNTVKASGIAAAVPGLGAAVTAITNGAGAVQGAGELPLLNLSAGHLLL